MRERAQASVETIALTLAALALAAALLTGVVRGGPPLVSVLGQALGGAFSPGVREAPALDGFERALLAAATGAGADGPTLLDLRAHLRSRLDRQAADAAFAAILRPLVAHTLAANAVDEVARSVAIVDRATEDAWLHDRFHPGGVRRLADLAIGLAGAPGAVIALAQDTGLVDDDSADVVQPGRAAGDIVVRVGSGLRQVIVRRRPADGLTVIADSRLRLLSGGQP